VIELLFFNTPPVADISEDVNFTFPSPSQFWNFFEDELELEAYLVPKLLIVSQGFVYIV
jgi:hypothetical protein